MKDFSRALLLPLMALGALVSLIFLLRTYGLSQHHEPVSHPQFSAFRVYSATDQGHDFFRSICFEGPLKKWSICEDPNPFVSTTQASLGQPIEDFLKLAHGAFTILNLVTPDIQAAKNLADTVHALGESTNLAFISHFQPNLSELRKIEPRWIYGLPPQLITKLFVAESVYLETLVSLSTDYVVLPLDLFEKKRNSNMLPELKRRGIALIVNVGDRTRKDVGFSEAALQVVRGVITNNPEAWQEATGADPRAANPRARPLWVVDNPSEFSAL